MSTDEIHTSAPNQRKSDTPVWRWIILAAAVLGGLWFGIQALQNAEPAGANANAGANPGGGAQQQGPPPANVLTKPVIEESVQEKRRVTGTLRAVKRADVAAQESGAVASVAVDVGDNVKEGEAIATLDDRRLRASLAEAKSMLTAATAGVEEREAESTRATRDLEMKEQLFNKRAVSEREFLDSQREASVATARLQAARDQKDASQSGLDLLEVRVADLEVKAPFTGRVVERHVDPGEWIAPGNPVVTLVSSETVEAWMNVPERFIGAVAGEGSEFSIVADGTGVSAQADNVRLVADIDPVTRLFPVVVEIDDQDGALVPGQSVHTELPVGEAGSMLAVPVDAVIETFQGASVFKVVPSSEGGMPTAERIEVTVKFRRDAMAYIDSDSLRPGEQVVVEGNERLFPGTPLILGEQEPAEPEVKP